MFGRKAYDVGVEIRDGTRLLPLLVFRVLSVFLSLGLGLLIRRQLLLPFLEREKMMGFQGLQALGGTHEADLITRTFRRAALGVRALMIRCEEGIFEIEDRATKATFSPG